MTNSQFIIEGALLLLFAFLLGCAIGYLLRRAMFAEPVAAPATPTTAAPAIEPTRPAAAAAVPAPAPVAAAAPPKPPIKPRAAPKPAAPAAAPSDKDKPQGLSEPRGGRKDDLKQIKGIGPKIEGTLNGLGIYHFDQIAAWDRKAVAWVDHHLAFHGRIDREDWVSQAKAKSI